MEVKEECTERMTGEAETKASQGGRRLSWKKKPQTLSLELSEKKGSGKETPLAAPFSEEEDVSMTIGWVCPIGASACPEAKGSTLPQVEGQPNKKPRSDFWRHSYVLHKVQFKFT